jgi:hypothetical protein
MGAKADSGRGWRSRTRKVLKEHELIEKSREQGSDPL